MSFRTASVALVRLALVLLACTPFLGMHAQTCTPPPAPTITTADPHCPYDIVTASVAPPPTGSWFGVQWNIEGGVFSPSGTTWAEGETVQWYPTSSDPVTLRVAGYVDATCMTEIAIRQVAITSEPAIISAPASVCADSPQLATIDPPAQGGSWMSITWTITNGIFVDPYTGTQYETTSGENAYFRANGAGPVTLDVLAFDVEGCSSMGTAQVAVTSIAAPVITAEDEICPRSDHYATISAPESGSWGMVSWSITGGMFRDPYTGQSSQYATTPTVTYYANSDTEPIELRVEAQDMNGCSTPQASKIVDMRQIAAPAIFAEDEICPRSDHYVSIGAPADGSWMMVSWTISGGWFRDPYTGQSSQYANTPTATFYANTDATSVEITVEAIDSNGCMTPRATKLIDIRQIPAPVIFSDDEICPRSDHYVSIGAPESGNWMMVSWSITGGWFRDPYTGQPSQYANTPTALFYANTDATQVEISVEAIDSNGCMAPRATKLIDMRQIPAPAIFSDDEICPRSDHYVSIGAPESGNWMMVSWSIAGGWFRDPYSGQSTQYATTPTALFYANTDATQVEISVEAIDSNGCMAPRATKLIDIRQIAAPVIFSDDEICPRSDHYVSIGAPEAGNWMMVSWTIAGGMFRDPYTGQTSQYATTPTAQFYANPDATQVEISVEAIDIDGCMAPRATKLIDIRQIAAPVIYADTEVCPGSDHFASIGAPEAGSWSVVSWSITGGLFRDGMTGQTSTSASTPNVLYFADGSSPVTLTVSGIDVNGCLSPSSSQTIALSAAAPPVISTVTATCPNADRTASIDASWSSAAWTIAWGTFSNGTTSATGNTVTYRADESGNPVTLSVTASSSMGCSASASQVVPVSIVDPPTIETMSPETCVYQPVNATISAGQWASIQWTIEGATFHDGSTVASGDGVMFTPYTSGPVTLTVTATDVNGCTPQQATRIIDVRAPEALVVNADLRACPNVPRTATVTGAVAEVTWTITGGTFAGGATTATGTEVTYIPGNEFSVELTASSTGTNGCPTTGYALVALGAGNGQIFVPDTTVCAGATGTANPGTPARGPWASVTWSIANGTGTPSGLNFNYTVGQSGVTTISMTAVDDWGCVVNESIDITIESPTATINASGPTHLCQNQSVTLTAVENGSYLWSNGATTKSITVSAAGNYSVAVTNASGCTTTSAPVGVTTEPLISLGIDDDHNFGPLCEGRVLTLTASVANATSYLWSTGETTRSIVITESGTYSVTVTMPSGCAKTVSRDITFSMAPKPTLTANGPAQYCDTTLVISPHLDIPPQYPGFAVTSSRWIQEPAGQGFGLTGGDFTAHGTGTVWYELTYSNGCVRRSDPFVFTKLETPDAWSASWVPMCGGGPTTLDVYGDDPNVSVTWSTGETGRSIVVTEPGMYSWTATGGADNCSITRTIEAREQAPEPATVTASGATTFCEGGSVTLTADQESNSYLWSNGATTRSITVSESGAYTVTLRAPSSCMVTSAPVQVTANATPTATVSGTAAICAGGSATISAALTGTGPWNVTWSDGLVQNGVTASPATRVVSPSTTTSYSVTSVSDAYCAGTASGTATITVNANPAAGIRALATYDETRTGTVTQNGENVEACGNPIVRLVPEDLNGAYTYAWSTGAATAVLDVETSGTYSVTVTTPSGCATTSTVHVTVTPYPAKPVITAPQTELCPAGGSVTLSAPNATSWSWSNGATTQSIVVTEPGSYTVRVSDGSCASPVSDAVVVTRGVSSIVVTGSTSLCEDGSVTLTANDGTSWLWSNGATTRSITVTAPGSYSVTTSNGSCASDASAPVVVTQREAAIGANGPTSFCDGESVVLTATEGASYLWSTGETSRSITASASGSYDVLVTFADGCAMRTAPVVVDVHQVAASIVADRTAVCEGGSIALTSSVSGGNSYSYQWYDDTYQPIAGATASTLTHAPSRNGFVYLKVTDELGCEATSNAIVYQVYEPVNATISASGPTTFCESGSVTLSAPEGYAYLWSNGSNASSITVNASGTYGVTITNGACVTTGSVTVTVNPLPTATITADGPLTFCDGGAVTLSAPEGYSYLWSNGATSRSITVNASGTYSVTTTLGSCTATDSKTVTVNPMPTATITADGPLTFCDGGAVTLSAPEGYSYLWSNGATSRSITVNASGTYTVTTTLGSCTATDSKTVTVNPMPTATITADGPLTFCDGSAVTLSAPEGYSYLWSNGATSRSITVNASGTYSVTTTLGSCTATDSKTVMVNPMPTATITADGPLTFCDGGAVTLSAPEGYSYLWSNGATSRSITVDESGTYTVTTTLGSCTATDSKTVTVNPMPTATITADGPLTFCDGGAVTLSAPEGYSYLWSNGATSRSITVDESGTYSVTTTLGACTATDSKTVTVNPMPTATITADGPLTFCDGGAVTLSAPEGYSYLWSNGATSRSITVDESGTYTVTTTLGSCTATDSKTVTVNPMPTATITADGPLTFCDGGQVKLSAPVGATSYLWSNGATSREITVVDGGIYTVTATLGSCTATDSKTVTVNPMPTATITADGPLTFCDGGQVKLSAPVGATSYLWSNGATSREITVVDGGIYTVTATLGSCSATDSVTVVVNAVPDATITADGALTFCDGGQVTLSAPVGATSYLWNTGATSRVITVDASGTYTVTATLGSCTSTDSRVVTELDPTTISGEPQNVTMPRNVVRTLSVTATGAAPLTYQWYRGSSGVTTTPIAGATNATLDVVQSKKGTYTYWVRVRSSTCTTSFDDSRTVTVTVN